MFYNSSKLERPLALLLDFDGTLFDSEHAHFAALKSVLVSLGHTLTASQYAQHHLGVTIPETSMQLVKSLRLPVTATSFSELRQEAYNKTKIEHPPKLFPGGAKLLAYCRSVSLPICLVSGSARDVIAHALNIAGLTDYPFQSIIARDDCVKSKPHPEPYLRALSDLALSPLECLCIEDTTNGYQSATGAGLPCMVISHSDIKQRVDGAVSIQGFDNVLDLLQRRSHGQLY